MFVFVFVGALFAFALRRAQFVLFALPPKKTPYSEPPSFNQPLNQIAYILIVQVSTFRVDFYNLVRVGVPFHSTLGEGHTESETDVRRRIRRRKNRIRKAKSTIRKERRAPKKDTPPNQFTCIC